MILLGYLNLGEKVTVEFERRGQMVQRLLEVPILKVRLAQLCIGCDQDEEILLVDVDEQLAKCKLLNAHLNYSIGILAHSELIKSLVALDKLPTDSVVHLSILLLCIERLLMHLLLVLATVGHLCAVW